MTQEEVVLRVLDALTEAGVDYMLTGSFASNLHGSPRMTRDADVVVDLSEPRALRLIALLGDDFYASQEAALEAVRFHRLFNVIDLQTGFKVDLIVKKDRPFSDEEFRRRIPGVLGGRQLPFATPEDTVLSKLEWARLGDSERQFMDACGVLRIQDDRLDWPYLERWAASLNVADLLARAARGAPFRED